MIDINHLRKFVSYDPDTGEFTWLRTSGKALIGNIAGTEQSKGYISIGICRRHFLAHRLAWAFVYSAWPVSQIDHVNTNKKDNRIANLRLATNTQNHANRGPQRNSTSGIKGVYWFKPQQKWKAQIMVKKQSIFLGYFDSKDAAIEARRNAENKYQSEFAWRHSGPPTIAYGR